MTGVLEGSNVDEKQTRSMGGERNDNPVANSNIQIVRRRSRSIRCQRELPEAKRSLLDWCHQRLAAKEGFASLELRRTGRSNPIRVRPRTRPPPVRAETTRAAKQTTDRPYLIRQAEKRNPYRGVRTKAEALRAHHAKRLAGRRSSTSRGSTTSRHHAKCANALFASAMRWTFSRRDMATPSRL